MFAFLKEEMQDEKRVGIHGENRLFLICPCVSRVWGGKGAWGALRVGVERGIGEWSKSNLHIASAARQPVEPNQRPSDPNDHGRVLEA